MHRISITPHRVGIYDGIHDQLLVSPFQLLSETTLVRSCFCHLCSISLYSVANLIFPSRSYQYNASLTLTPLPKLPLVRLIHTHPYPDAFTLHSIEQPTNGMCTNLFFWSQAGTMRQPDPVLHWKFQEYAQWWTAAVLLLSGAVVLLSTCVRLWSASTAASIERQCQTVQITRTELSVSAQAGSSVCKETW